MKLCYEIQKVEEERESQTLSTATPEEQTVKAEAPKNGEAAPEPEEVPKEPPVELTKKEEAIVEELKAPDKATPTQKHRHILSWLLDSSSDEE